MEYLDRARAWAAEFRRDADRTLSPSTYEFLANLRFRTEVAASRMRLDRRRIAPTPEMIDADQLVEETGFDSLARDADAYFGAAAEGTDAVRSDDAHLTKPFTDGAEAAQFLSAAALMIDGLGLVKGMRVLDFGAGTGWLSRLLVQLGCDVVVADVSPKALSLARRNIEEFGGYTTERPEVSYLLMRSPELNLPDESFDRIVCFDTLHHCTDPTTTIAQFGRVLVTGGVAGFHEPGPDHSREAHSQFEMRTHGFLERDIVIEDIWSDAQRSGFEHLQFALSGEPILGLSAQQYDRFLRWSVLPAPLRRRLWHRATAQRVFFLSKAGRSVLDSRQHRGLEADIEVTSVDQTPEETVMEIAIHNIGRADWLESTTEKGAVWLGVHLCDDDGTVIDLDHRRIGVPALSAGERARVSVSFDRMTHPEGFARFDMVSEGVTWFAKVGSSEVDVPLGRAQATR